MYLIYVRCEMLYAPETLATAVATLNHLRRNDSVMLIWICNGKAIEESSSNALFSKVGIQKLEVKCCTKKDDLV